MSTYGAIAKEIGQPSAARAVGRALGSNPIPIVIPCHRVIGASGALTGYAGGIDRKVRLLGWRACSLRRDPSARERLDTLKPSMGAESPKEECGLFGVWAPGEDVARLTYFGLFAQQHRGQESAGIAVSDGTNILVYKDLGLVSQVFNEATLTTLHGDLAIGHTRYSTTGSTPGRTRSPSSRPTASVPSRSGTTGTS